MSKVEIKVPSVGESVAEVTLSTWLKQDGDFVKIDEPLCELESEKATFELPSEVAGVLQIVAQAGSDLKIGDVVCIVDTSQTATETSEQPVEKVVAKVAEKQPDVQPVTNKDSYAANHPSPAAKKILDEKGIDAKEVKGTGKDNRITKEDALKAEKPASVANIATQTVSGTFSRDEKVEKMSRLRRTISKRLVAAKNETAMLTTFNEVDMTRIMQIREQYKKSFEETKGIGLGFMSFFTKACAIALQKFPAINAYLEEENIIFHDFCDISIAVSTPKGLVVPVIRNAESLSFAEIEMEVKRLATLGRDGNLTMEDMTGGTFTITNGGVFGSLLSTPIINQPQSAILGMHKIQERPMAINGKVEIRPMMYVALSYDHRIVDGKESVGFLVTVKDMLENPEKMLYGQDPVKVLLGL
ncbi:MAG: 2-oxoglutarate dehydrogenase complex dihydrolipoyllysine-residue succinyltransferase [Chitinophagales bacterium]|nr:2-oxoglutarate dehydrogenase complex dihydrolipoyllysine-residue succinyltransferase [Chitinophagales bacterium]